MKLFILVCMVALGVAHPDGYKDELDLSARSVLQTVRNVITLPRFLGGGKHVDSDVRFGWSHSDEDLVGASGNKAHSSDPWGVKSLLGMMKPSPEDQESEPSFRVSPGVFDPPNAGGALNRDLRRRGLIPRSRRIYSRFGSPVRRTKPNDDPTANKPDGLGFLSAFFS